MNDETNWTHVEPLLRGSEVALYDHVKNRVVAWVLSDGSTVDTSRADTNVPESVIARALVKLGRTVAL